MPVPITSPPSSLLSPLLSPLSPATDHSPPNLFVSPHFTCTTAVNHHLLILDSLAPTTCPCNTRQTTRNTYPTSFHLSANSSSDESHAYIPPRMSSTASVESTSRKAPVLTGRDVTPAVMMEFENACMDFFEAKLVLVDKQVTFILPSIKDFHICNWIATDHATIVTLPFTSFMSQFHKNSSS